MNFNFYAFSIKLILLVALTVSSISCRKKAETLPEYSMYTAIISCRNGESISSIGYAVVYAEKGALLQLQTAKHIVFEKKHKYFLTFKSGISCDVTSVHIPEKSADIAIVSVSKTALKRGRDYQLPLFPKVEAYKRGEKIYIWHDEYDNYPERKIDMVNNKQSIVSFFVPGKIASGRSGSPVFLKNTNMCLGIVSGHFNKDSAIGEQIMCILYTEPSQMERGKNKKN